MSLNWDISRVKGWKEVSEGEEWTITNALIWTTMAVGLGEITEKNVDEWMVRLRVLEMTDSAPLSKGGKTEEIEREWVERRIGLSTNVFPNKTRKQFEAQIGRVLCGRAARIVESEKAKVEEKVEKVGG